ncbi:hypothetical protein M0812_21169 [Anaeramoeba flamelloides]|uniref:CYRIA/CYRIB Rac1 binding domain-containing protein n=1 Tax=Anaeramoeba flamelloides TaxID=1746091 RepID=A0AAV7YR50_9EUKA|nr:hypothetical protein M0812_21169 [Anaeramoeba flamelloides]
MFSFEKDLPGMSTIKKRKIKHGTRKLLYKTWKRVNTDQVDLRRAVKCPQDEDIKDWLAIGVVDFYNKLNMLRGSIVSFCTKESCPSMTAGAKFEYYWPVNGKPTRLSAPDYLNELFVWIENQLDNPDVFPPDENTSFPRHFASKIVPNIFRRLARVFAHIYHCHFNEMVEQLNDSEPQTEKELEIYNQASEILNQSSTVLEDFQNYKGCGQQIRKAISEPSEKNELLAWEAVLPLVEQQSYYFTFYMQIRGLVETLLREICSGDTKETSNRLVSLQALVKHFVHLLDFVIRFDYIKMEKPEMQNDFSYYRRYVNRKRSELDINDLVVSDQDCDSMSLTFAYPAPMLKGVIDTMKAFKGKRVVPEENLTQGLSSMVNVFYYLLENKKIENKDTKMFCLRAMVATLVIFDHVDEKGAFHNKSLINVKGCLTLLANFDPKQQSLINIVKFSSAHWRDEKTKQSLKAILN